MPINPITRRIGFIILFLIWVLPSAGWARDDFQYRQLVNLKLIDTPKIDFSFLSEMRMNHDVQDISFYLISPQLKYDLWKNLSLGFNYSYVNLKIDNPAAGRSEFKFHHRLEPEISPHWDIGGQNPWLKIQLRERYEFRWIEDQGPDNPRFRHRMNFEFPVQNKGPLLAVYTNSEFFYDINDHRYNENWTVPFGLKFKIHPQATVSVFYMIQSKLTDTWTSSQSLGSYLNINF